MDRRTIERLKIPESLRIPYIGGIIYKYLSGKENKEIRDSIIPSDALNHEKRDLFVTASMTSFPARIDYVHLALKTILLQSYRPDRVILWLAEEQFPEKNLPSSLTDLKQYGLEIIWCDDLYGHKKYYYCVKNQKPNEVVITFDDDILYPYDCIRRLVETHKRYPECLVCERAQSIDYEKDGSLKNPGRWKTISNNGVKMPSYSLNPSPGGGCLIPYKGFYHDALDKKKIRDLAFKNDDLWYMFMAAEQGTKTIKTQKYHKPFTLIEGSQMVQMATENVVGNYNMIIMERLKKAYPLAYRRIVSDED